MSILKNKRIVITRATHQASTFVTLLRQHQAIPIVYPCIAIVPPADTTQLDAYLKTLNTFDWLILTSTNTVYALQERLTVLDIQPDWTQFFVGVVGHKTAQAVYHHFQHHPDFIPKTFTAESLAQSLPIKAQDRIFVPQSALADHTLAEILRQRGAEITCVTAYETVMGTGGENVPVMMQEGEIDVLTFTSPSTIGNFAQRIEPLPLPELPVLCIGSSTADRARHYGFRQIIVPKSDYTVDGMVDALIQYYETRSINPS